MTADPLNTVRVFRLPSNHHLSEERSVQKQTWCFSYPVEVELFPSLLSRTTHVLCLKVTYYTTRGRLSNRLVMANHTHTWGYNMSPLQ